MRSSRISLYYFNFDKFIELPSLSNFQKILNTALPYLKNNHE